MIITAAREQPGIGVGILDCDHREMDEAFKELNAEIATGARHSQVGHLLRGLAKFTLIHFALEEGMMEVTKYPMINRHRTNHRRLMQRVNSLVSRYNQDGPISDRQLLSVLTLLSHEHVEADDAYFGNWMNRA
jgi:hemerythrin-like metal-binding protein